VEISVGAGSCFRQIRFRIPPGVNEHSNPPSPHRLSEALLLHAVVGAYREIRQVQTVFVSYENNIIIIVGFSLWPTEL